MFLYLARYGLELDCQSCPYLLLAGFLVFGRIPTRMWSRLCWGFQQLAKYLLLLRMDGMNLWSTGISAMALATSSVPNLISTGLISIPVLKLPTRISCSLSFCISTVLLVSGSSSKASNASMASSLSVVVHVSCPMGSTLGCTVVFSGSDGTFDVGVLLLIIESLRVCSTARLFVGAFSCPSDCVRELFLRGS